MSVERAHTRACQANGVLRVSSSCLAKYLRSGMGEAQQIGQELDILQACRGRVHYRQIGENLVTREVAGLRRTPCPTKERAQTRQRPNAVAMESTACDRRISHIA